jgi:hypothetical protein
MANQIAGNVVANNARIRLTSTAPSTGTQFTFVTYSNSSGVYTFTGIPTGTYQLVADLNEVTASPYNTGYEYVQPVIVVMDVAGDNIVDLNLTPTLINAADPF